MLFVGDDWAEDHHDAGIVAGDGRRLARRRLPERLLAGCPQRHALIAGYLPGQWADLPPGEAARRVKTGTGTGRGPWARALVAAGYEVFPASPVPVGRYRDRHCSSGAESDAADAHLLASDRPPGDRAYHRPVAGDWPQAEAVKLAARAHQSLVGDRSGHVLRLRAALGEFFPAALQAFPDLGAPQARELLGRAPGPDRAAALSRSKGETTFGVLGDSGSALAVPDPTTVLDVVGYPGAPEGDADAYLKPDAVHTAFAQDLPEADRWLIAASQRPLTLAANTTPSGAPAWKGAPELGSDRHRGQDHPARSAAQDG